MRVRTLSLLMLMLPAMAFAACGGASVVRDWGLHLQWQVERDCDHPGRPARLVEVPWTVPALAPAQGEGAEAAASQTTPEVRSGMTVTLCRRSDEADIHLRGIALGPARTGEKVRVRTGIGSTALEGIVRGPGLVELLPGRSGH
jgi:hypothetical protein